MTDAADFELDEELVAGAASVIHGYIQSRQRAKRTTLNEEDVTVRYARMADAEGAILYYLRAMRERGYALMPREPTDDMVNQPDAWVWLIEPDNYKGQCSARVWRAMWDAAAGPDCLRKGPVETTAVSNEQSKSAPIKPSEKEG